MSEKVKIEVIKMDCEQIDINQAFGLEEDEFRDILASALTSLKEILLKEATWELKSVQVLLKEERFQMLLVCTIIDAFNLRKTGPQCITEDWKTVAAVLLLDKGYALNYSSYFELGPEEFKTFELSYDILKYIIDNIDNTAMCQLVAGMFFGMIGECLVQ